MKYNIIGIVGFIGSGKGTVGEYLVSHHGFKSESFAKNLKDSVSAIFGWPRALLEGDTEESRIWRERPDAYWSTKLNKPVTPRWVLQYMGTEVMRNNFIDDIWILSLEKRIADATQPIVITDVRFPNEVAMIKRLGGTLLWVRRSLEPSWLELALTDKPKLRSLDIVHPSEYEWVGVDNYIEVQNIASLNELHSIIDNIVK